MIGLSFPGKIATNVTSVETGKVLTDARRLRSLGSGSGTGENGRRFRLFEKREIDDLLLQKEKGFTEMPPLVDNSLLQKLLNI